MEICMKVKVSPKYQIVIPSDIRKSLNIKPGEKIEIIPYENRIECIPLKNIPGSDEGDPIYNSSSPGMIPPEYSILLSSSPLI